MSELRTNRIVPRDGLASGAYVGIIQVKYANSTTVQTIATTTYTDTGLAVTITPTRADSAVLLMISLNSNGGGTNSLKLRLIRTVGGSDTTVFEVGEALVDYGTSNIHVQGIGTNYVDTPSTTSAVTYKVQFAGTNGSGNLSVNNNGRSDIVAMEISG